MESITKSPSPLRAPYEKRAPEHQEPAFGTCEGCGYYRHIWLVKGRRVGGAEHGEPFGLCAGCGR